MPRELEAFNNLYNKYISTYAKYVEIPEVDEVRKALVEKEKEGKVINIISKIDGDILSHMLEDTLLAGKITQEEFNLIKEWLNE